MAKIADVVVAWTGAARCTELLVVLLVVSLIINIILGCLYGEAGCAVEETMEPKGIKVEAAEKIISHTTQKWAWSLMLARRGTSVNACLLHGRF